MKTVTNRFGEGTLYEAKDLGRNVYCLCTACMSVWSEFLSWANEEKELQMREFHDKPSYATDTIIVLGCQVTDLAVLNDLRAAEELHEKFPNTPIYMGGCLAQRFDIELPNWLGRLDVTRTLYQEIKDKSLVDWQKPFWVEDLEADYDMLQPGNLFRNFYPLKIGAGCHGKCKYCTIRDTRGDSYTTCAYGQEKEFRAHENVVLVSDSPTVQQIKDWCNIAEMADKQISFRNVEPHIANICFDDFERLADKRLLKILHCPIQSHNIQVLQAMNRDVESTLKFVENAQILRLMGVLVATNIIIDYVVDGELVHNMDADWLNENFDYWSWNPYFDGNWDRKKAEERFAKYIK